VAEFGQTYGTARTAHPRRPGKLGVLVLVVALLGIALPRVDAAAAATPTFVQVRAKEITSGTANSLAFSSANTAGNLIVVYAIWNNTGSATVSDSRGNTPTPPRPPAPPGRAPRAHRSFTPKTSPPAPIP
jgi:hypothetical protein